MHHQLLVDLVIITYLLWILWIGFSPTGWGHCRQSPLLPPESSFLGVPPTGSPWSQCCIWCNSPPLFTSHTGIVIWHPRKCFGLVPILFNWPHSNSSYQEMYIWAPWAEVWCATGIRSGSHTIHHLHHTTGKTHQEAWSDFPSLRRRYAALFSI